MNAQPLLTPSDVAQRLNVSLRAAYDMLAPGGKLHHLRIELGRKTLRVDAAALEHEIKAGTVSYADS